MPAAAQSSIDAENRFARNRDDSEIDANGKIARARVAALAVQLGDGRIDGVDLSRNTRNVSKASNTRLPRFDSLRDAPITATAPRLQDGLERGDRGDSVAAVGRGDGWSWKSAATGAPRRSRRRSSNAHQIRNP